MTEIHAGRYEIDADRETVLRAEVLDVLSAARAPMTLRQIAEAAAPVAEPGNMNIGAGPIADQLSCLISQGAVERVCGTDGRATFQLRRPALPANSATAATAAPTGTEPAPKSPAADSAEKRPHGDLILEALRARGPMTRHEAAQAAGCSPKRASDVLGILKGRGLAERISNTDWAATGPQASSATAPPKPAKPAKPANADTTDSAPPQPSAATPATPATEKPGLTPLIALRSDGIIEIRRADAPTIELAQTDIAELWKFISGLRSALA